ncbi:unnamed protein product [Nippostrongylus brasiliensis]|uniref:Endoribonuclease n=1 Tax=Nippostrongylus brasiliensis TaxID=27835 RepID=A0A0N4YY88_NIPBR|nr:unnamed protein product [Nippostrongylus brasiliensis]
MQLLVLLAAVVGPSLTQSTLPPLQVTDAELVEMSNRLRIADENKAYRGGVTVDFQGHTNTRDTEDNAPKNLFVSVDQSLLQRPSYQNFLQLTDNFYRETGVAEPRVSQDEVSSEDCFSKKGVIAHPMCFQERREIKTFLTYALSTKPWQLLYGFLDKKKYPLAKDPNVFYQWMNQLWFAHYSRAKGKADTSGFEHVFIGEEKNKEVSGLHNWVRYYTLERNASENVNYMGFVIKRAAVMASVKFSWRGDLKRSGSLLFGTSPEFDMALYTLCFLARRGQNQCKVIQSEALL